MYRHLRIESFANTVFFSSKCRYRCVVDLCGDHTASAFKDTSTSKISKSAAIKALNPQAVVLKSHSLKPENKLTNVRHCGKRGIRIWLFMGLKEFLFGSQLYNLRCWNSLMYQQGLQNSPCLTNALSTHGVNTPLRKRKADKTFRVMDYQLQASLNSL